MKMFVIRNEHQIYIYVNVSCEENISITLGSIATGRTYVIDREERESDSSHRPPITFSFQLRF